MDRNTYIEIIGGGILVGLLVLIVNPVMLWMPSLLMYCVCTFVLAGFALFAGMVWREYSHDEREVYHALYASRVAYLVGLTVLVCGVIYQALIHNVDSWLVATIVSMVLVKLLLRIYVQITQ